MKRILILSFLLLSIVSPRSYASNYIVGGKIVSPEDPITDSTVGVYTPSADGRSGALCTGTLIKKDIALTAAHCIEPGTKPTLIFNRDLHSPGAAHRASEGVAVNQKWQKLRGQGMDQGDIALVKFDGRLPEGYHPVPTLPRAASLRSGEKVTLAGYGISNARKKTGAGRLRKTQVSVLNDRPGKSEMILDQAHGHGACHGDSGGPAFVRTGSGIALAGLTNRSYPDSAPDDCAHDVVYTKVPAYKKWIQTNESRLEKSPSAFHLRRVRMRVPNVHNRIRSPILKRPRFTHRR
jgi:hypothetical protein